MKSVPEKTYSKIVITCVFILSLSSLAMGMNKENEKEIDEEINITVNDDPMPKPIIASLKSCVDRKYGYLENICCMGDYICASEHFSKYIYIVNVKNEQKYFHIFCEKKDYDISALCSVGNILLSGACGRIKAWKLEGEGTEAWKWKSTKILNKKKNFVTAFCNIGEYLVISFSGEFTYSESVIEVLNPKKNFEQVTSYSEDYSLSVLCSSKEFLFCGGRIYDNGKVTVYDIKSNALKLVKKLEFYNPVEALCCNNDHLFVGNRSYVRVFNIKNSFTCEKTLESVNAVPKSMWCNDDYLILLSGDSDEHKSNIQIWDIKDNFKCISTLRGENISACSICDVCNYFMVAFKQNNCEASIKIWNLNQVLLPQNWNKKLSAE